MRCRMRLASACARLCQAIVFICVILSDRISAASAAEPGARLWREVWAGADVSSHVWLLYSGTTVAPLGDIWSDGLRLRAAGGYGRYSYHYHSEHEVGGKERHDYEAALKFTDALIGYYKRLGPLTAKAFGGVSFIEHAITPFDPHNAVIGPDVGLKGVAEFWLNMTDKSWASLDLAYTTAHKTSAARSRLGYRLLPTVSLGLEAAFNGNAEDMGGRAGAFIRYEWFGGEISLGAGASNGTLGKSTSTIADDLKPYATINWVMQF